ncbi:ClC family H(+)/Cl(-) exchange transporter [Anaerobium acetethylicum]|uniref:H+/Cl-antiporter ClcA n=1 Tax=Anaerobium acetethylicum TaxID=1619234 RepID=A0A1D3TR58_9FIRM|nr:ClC family H(+)/Cl(-) exchange transporter [Anaerobium acetethylicum]SCP96118.1 H+/Cl-antiporter ClcA [Anaerobium acetethylicum]
MKNNYKILTDDNYGKIALIFKSLLVGMAAGGVVVMYRITLTYAEEFAFGMYGFMRENLHMIPVLLAGLCLAAYFVGFLVSKNNMISGSGIPQLKGILGGYFAKRKNWLHILCSKFVGGAIAISAGLSLGREGPSIQLGASIAEGIGKKVGKSRLERKILMASGASAGLAAAFNAPMAGVVFALEEIFKYFSPVILLSTMSAAVAADFLSKEVFGIAPVFEFEVTRAIPLRDYWMLILLGIIMGIMGAFYNYALLKTQKLYGKMKFLNERTRPIIPFMMAGILGLAFPVVLGGGHRIIEELTLQNGIWFISIIFILKFIFSAVSFGSGTPGGIFFPLLVLGASVGAIFAGISINYFGIESDFFYNFVILAMAGYFTAIVRAPITGIVLIMEMTGSFTHMLSLTVVAVTAYVAADLLKSPPIYDALLENLIKKEHVDSEREHSRKILIEIVVQHGSEFEDCHVRAIEWPEKILLVGVKRGEREIIPKGGTEIKAGDYLFILADVSGEARTREMLNAMNEQI